MKIRSRQFYRWVLPHFQEIDSPSFIQIRSDNRKWGNTTQPIFQDKYNQTREQRNYEKWRLWILLIHEYRCKTPKKILVNQTQQRIEKTVYHNQNEFILDVQGWFNIRKIYKCTLLYYWINMENYMIISVDMKSSIKLKTLLW